MTITVCKLPHLPRTGKDGDEVCDKYGNRWRFNAEEDGWISHGAITPPPVVTESTNGIITPTIFDQLSKIRQFVKTNQSLAPLKLVPGTDAHWYYFRSSDKFIRFRPEAEDVLRIEVDKGRMFQVIMKEVCPGKRGPQGDKGKRGQSGIPGPAEVCYQPLIDGDTLNFAVFTPTPLLGDRTDIVLPNNHVPDISVRLYPVTLPKTNVVAGKLSAKRINQRQRGVAELYDQLQHLAIYYHSHDEILPKFQKTRDLLVQQSLGTSTEDQLCGIPLSRVLVLPLGSDIGNDASVEVLIDPLGVKAPRVIFDQAIVSIDVERTIETIKYNPLTHIVCGSIFLLDKRHWTGTWCLKSRQKGPDGSNGIPGESAIRIVECTLDATSVVATCPIINSRLDCDSSTIFTLCSDIISTICVDRVRFNPAAGGVSDKTGIDAVFASAQMILDDCKLIYRYQIKLAEDEFDDLNLAYWDPQPGCTTKRHYANQNFDWPSLTTDNKCEPFSTWYDATLKSRSGKYPNAVTIAKPPAEDECCQDDFFWCPNIQDGGCTPANSAPPPPTTAPPSQGASQVVSSPLVLLSADFSFLPANPSIGDVVTFRPTVNGGTLPYTYSWDFGDAAYPPNTSTLAVSTHKYEVAGQYTVVLIVTDKNDATVRVTHIVEIGGIVPSAAPKPQSPKSRKWRT